MSLSMLLRMGKLLSPCRTTHLMDMSSFSILRLTEASSRHGMAISTRTMGIYRLLPSIIALTIMCSVGS